MKKQKKKRNNDDNTSYIKKDTISNGLIYNFLSNSNNNKATKKGIYNTINSIRFNSNNTNSTRSTVNNGISDERLLFLKNIKEEKFLVFITQITLLLGFIIIWEVLARLNIIDSFITSMPSRILKTFMNLSENNLIHHIFVTTTETVIGFSVGTALGILIATILWWSAFLKRVLDPFLVVLNSLPKVALRAYYYFMGWCWNAINYCYGCCNFFNCNNTRKSKWFYKNR